MTSRSKNMFCLLLFLFIQFNVNSQIEVVHIRCKNFSGFGFGAFLNLSFPVYEADYISFEAGLYGASKYDLNVGTSPFLASYRYTIDRSGYGFYLEPTIGYSIGEADIGDDRGKLVINGIASGFGIGYLFESSGRYQSNFGLRYVRSFGLTGVSILSLRYSLSYRFGKRE